MINQQFQIQNYKLAVFRSLLKPASFPEIELMQHWYPVAVRWFLFLKLNSDLEYSKEQSELSIIAIVLSASLGKVIVFHFPTLSCLCRVFFRVYPLYTTSREPLSLPSRPEKDRHFWLKHWKTFFCFFRWRNKRHVIFVVFFSQILSG